jgi:hypothetical protein
MGIGFGMYKATFASLWRDLKKLKFLVAPLLIGLFPVLSLYQRNIQDILPSLIVHPILLVIAITIAGSLALRFITKDNIKIGVILSLAWIFFFFYVPLIDLAAGYNESVRNLDSILLPIWAGLFLTLTWFIFKANQPLSSGLNFLVVVGTVVVAIQLFGVLSYTVQARETDFNKYLVDDEYKTLQDNDDAQLPDIYYILLDGYPRSDTLEEYFDFDNSVFDGFLESRNFSVADDSYTNYSQTALAIPAILNMSYIKDLPEKGGIPLTELMELYHNNKILNYLKPAGYKWIHNTNYYRAGDNPNADLNIRCDASNEFLKELVGTTILEPFDIISDQQRQDLRTDGLCVIDAFDSSLPGPTFTFSHIISPHPPYVYGPDGEDVSEVNLGLNSATRWLAKGPFIDQLQYLNKRLIEKVQAILDKSSNSIIIIQSDHGTLSSATEAVNLADIRPVVLKERHRNYLAIYLPVSCNPDNLTSTITGVNTFRMIFNNCFDADYEELVDKVYYNKSGPAGYKSFKDITDEVRN